MNTRRASIRSGCHKQQAHAPNDISRYIDSEVEGANVYSYYAYDAIMLAADLMGRVPAHAHTPPYRSAAGRRN